MHHTLACQPGERRHREHHELVQLADNFNLLKWVVIK